MVDVQGQQAPGGGAMPEAKVTYNPDNKFDIQLSAALRAERHLGNIFAYRSIEKIELKTETWQWEQKGNICIEYRSYGKPSGIAVTEADYWVHELRRDGVTLVYLMFPMDRLKQLCRQAIKEGKCVSGAGDDKAQDVVLLPLVDILRADLAKPVDNNTFHGECACGNPGLYHVKGKWYCHDHRAA